MRDLEAIGLFPEILPDAEFGDQRLGSVLKREQYGIKQNLRTHPRRNIRFFRCRHESPATEKSRRSPSLLEENEFVLCRKEKKENAFFSFYFIVQERNHENGVVFV